MREDILTSALEDIVVRSLRCAIKEVMDDAYLAGIFDGEGSVYLNDGRWRVSVTNTHYHTLERFKERFGGSIQERARQKSTHTVAWNWSGSGYVAQRMAEALLPFLEIKREGVEQAMEEEWGVTKIQV